MVSVYDSTWGAIEIVLASLYAPGAPRGFHVPRRGWRQVESTLRKFPGVPPCRALARAGFYAEATLLDDTDLAKWAADRLAEGSLSTAVSPGFPQRWVEVLGRACPPVVWITRSWPSGPFIGGVGSRLIRPDVHRSMSEVGLQSVLLGFDAVSGGAEGCDSAFAEGVLQSGGSILEFLPRGILPSDFESPGCRVSAAPPGAAFTAALAMERNALIYALGETTVVGSVRLGEGGSWNGAREALRRRLGRVAVLKEPPSAGFAALVGLGAFPMNDATDVADALRHPGVQPDLPTVGGKALWAVDSRSSSELEREVLRR